MDLSEKNKKSCPDDIERLRGEYERRDRDLNICRDYSPFNPAHLYNLQSRQRQMLSLLRQAGIPSLEGLRILDLGCGYGGTSLELLHAGASPETLHRCDILFYRLAGSNTRLMNLPLINADGQDLPFSNGQFDLVLQSTVFSSILDSGLKKKIAEEIIRVQKPGGIILWYDFWLNPTNKQVSGIHPSEIKGLFPGHRFIFRRITLAPPLTRRLIRISWTACTLLESLKIFNSHYLGLIFK